MGFLWTIAGILAAAVVITLLGYILYCLIRAIANESRKGGGQDGR